MADHIDKRRYASSDASGHIPIDLKDDHIEFDPSDVDWDKYDCEHCDESFPHRLALREHNEVEHE